MCNSKPFLHGQVSKEMSATHTVSLKGEGIFPKNCHPDDFWRLCMVLSTLRTDNLHYFFCGLQLSCLIFITFSYVWHFYDGRLVLWRKPNTVQQPTFLPETWPGTLLGLVFCDQIRVVIIGVACWLGPLFPRWEECESWVGNIISQSRAIC